jgi:L,D-peptidoglycan transpeptidase YkuD (ErfK/YbiS/YcfS/YnhG family)
MKLHWLLTTLTVATSAGTVNAYAQEVRSEAPAIPKQFQDAIPQRCRQVVLVLSTSERAIPARLWLLERAGESDAWKAAAGPIAATLGRNGLAWGEGEHSGSAPDGFRTKREGDGCSPAGVFSFPFAFGYSPKEEAPGIRLPYIGVTRTMFAIDDSQSRFYNQVVDTLKVAKDWRSAEKMRRDDVLYRWGIYVAHNPDNRAFRGSCISLHIWRGPEQPTAGCTAMSEEHIKQVLEWLDPAKEPRLVQGVEGW